MLREKCIALNAHISLKNLKGLQYTCSLQKVRKKRAINYTQLKQKRGNNEDESRTYEVENMLIKGRIKI